MYPFKYQVLQDILYEWRIFPYEFKQNAKGGYYCDDFLTIEKEEEDKLHLKLVIFWDRDEDNLDQFGNILRDKEITIRFILRSNDYAEYERPMVEIWEDWGKFPLMPEEINLFIECCLFQEFSDKNGKVYENIKEISIAERREILIDEILLD